MTNTANTCSHKVVMNMDQRTICVLCTQELRYNKETHRHEEIPSPKYKVICQSREDRILENMRRKIIEAVGGET